MQRESKALLSQTMNPAEQFMSRCLELASNGLGTVAPNPMVGCVIVHDGKIIGEGYHMEFGKAHAEVNAINDVIEKHGAEILQHSTMYVSLEPCSHFGKTPPCVDLIIKNKIPKVYIGCMDSYAEVNGAGMRKLIDSGCQVFSDILTSECREFNKRFFIFHENKRPFIILKWAQTRDQFIAPKTITGENRWISNKHSRRLTHKWRSEEQAILVGTNTVKTDNPGLTIHDWKGKNPLRIVIDPLDSIDSDALVLNQTAPTLIFNESKKSQQGKTEWMPVDFSKNVLQTILAELYKRNIQSVIVEGGAFTLRNFIEQELWDEARIFIANKFLDEGVKAPIFNFTRKKSEASILDDQLYIFRNN